MKTNLIYTTGRRTSRPRVVTGAVTTVIGAEGGRNRCCDAARTRRDRRNRWVVTRNTMKQGESALHDQETIFAAQTPSFFERDTGWAVTTGHDSACIPVPDFGISDQPAEDSLPLTTWTGECSRRAADGSTPRRPRDASVHARQCESSRADEEPLPILARFFERFRRFRPCSGVRFGFARDVLVGGLAPPKGCITRDDRPGDPAEHAGGGHAVSANPMKAPTKQLKMRKPIRWSIASQRINPGNVPRASPHAENAIWSMPTFTRSLP
jgi:hypothetical protein